MFFGCRSMCEGKKPFLCKRRWLGKYETKLSNFGTCFSGLRMTARRERKRVKEEDKRRRSMDAQKRNEMKLENVVLVVGWKITRIVTLHNWYYELCTTTSMALPTTCHKAFLPLHWVIMVTIYTVTSLRLIKS